jgi:hypothetical protein
MSVDKYKKEIDERLKKLENEQMQNMKQFTKKLNKMKD